MRFSTVTVEKEGKKWMEGLQDSLLETDVKTPITQLHNTEVVTSTTQHRNLRTKYKENTKEEAAGKLKIKTRSQSKKL